MLQSVTEYYRALKSVTVCYRMFQSITECYRVLQSISSASTWTNFWAYFLFQSNHFGLKWPRVNFHAFWGRVILLVGSFDHFTPRFSFWGTFQPERGGRKAVFLCVTVPLNNRQIDQITGFLTSLNNCCAPPPCLNNVKKNCRIGYWMASLAQKFERRI